jgi:hypothetical protein
MSEVRIPIFIQCRSGEKAIEAWARNADAPLACHPIYNNASDDGAWIITHRKTGLVVNPSRTYSKDDALALIDIYAPLADWDGEPMKVAGLRDVIEAAYEQFEPSSNTQQSLTPHEQ